MKDAAGGRCLARKDEQGAGKLREQRILRSAVGKGAEIKLE
jgi:hypothetical protein